MVDVLMASAVMPGEADFDSYPSHNPQQGSAKLAGVRPVAYSNSQQLRPAPSAIRVVLTHIVKLRTLRATTCAHVALLLLLCPLPVQTTTATTTTTTTATTDGQSPWEVGKSSCPGYQGFKPRSVFPERGPLVFADFLIPAVKGKAVAEIGEREGDLILCLARHANSSYVIEMEQSSCDSVRKADPEGRIAITCKMVTKRNGEMLLPDADVYFWWNEPTNNMMLLEMVDFVQRKRNRTSTVYFAFDGSSSLGDLEHIAPTLERLKSREFSHSGHVTRLFFDESDNEGLYGDGPPDGVDPNGVAGDGVRGRKPWTASYKTPYFGRYGHWGILHVVSVTVGVQLESHLAPRSNTSRLGLQRQVKQSRGGRIAGGDVRRL